MKPVQRVWLGPGTGAVGLRTLVPFQSRSPLKHLPVGQDLRFRLREVLSLGSIYPTSCPSLALGAELKGRKKSNPQKDHPHPSSNSLAQPFDKLACSFPLVNPSAAIFPPPPLRETNQNTVQLLPFQVAYQPLMAGRRFRPAQAGRSSRCWGIVCPSASSVAGGWAVSLECVSSSTELGESPPGV